MKRIGEFIKWDMYISTSILIVCAVNFALHPEAAMPDGVLWQILLSGFLTTMVTYVCVLSDILKRLPMLIRYILHYIALCAVMIPCSNLFGWLSLNPQNIITMSISVAIVYVMAFGSYCLIDLGNANAINQKLKEKYKNEE